MSIFRRNGESIQVLYNTRHNINQRGLITRLCQNCAKTRSISLIGGLALTEKQTPQVVEKIEKPKEQMEGLESSVMLRRCCTIHVTDTPRYASF